MKTVKIFLALTLATLTTGQSALGQKNPVLWTFNVVPLSENDVRLSITAHLAPGWHIYSQYMKSEGPKPTSIIYAQDDSFTPIGPWNETGQRTKYFDEIYEIEIVRYSGTVDFSQRLQLNVPHTVIRGTIEYMTCNDHLCVPREKTFAVATMP